MQVHKILMILQSSISSTFKSSDDKAADDKPKDDTGSKTVKEPVNKEDQAYKDELDRLISQEKEASDAADALRKVFEQGCMDQRGATKAGSTNIFNTVSNPVNAASTLGTFSAGGPSSPYPNAFIPANTLLHVKQSEEGIFINQDKYVAEILKKFDFSSIKTASTPIETHKLIVKDEEAANVDIHLFRSMIGSLMYLIASRPDIMFADYACSSFQVTPKLSHLQAVKRIFRRLISWQCKKQTIVATSTTKADFGILLLPKQSINDEKQIHAIVDGKTVVITKSSVRRDPLFTDANGITCPTTEQIFENLLLMRTVTPLFATMLAQPVVVEGEEGTGFPHTRGPNFLDPSVDVKAVHKEGGNSLVRAATTASLDAQQDSNNITKTQSKATLNKPIPQGDGLGSGPERQKTMGGAMAQIRYEGALILSIDPPFSTGYTVGSGQDRMEYDIDLTDPVLQTPYDSPLSGGHTPESDERSMTLKELTDLYMIHSQSHTQTSMCNQETNTIIV
nr:putative ribonuclease H-like domain-containing protein [Tanacetum cinerariifolium]